jgi:hypothetical protein
MGSLTKTIAPALGGAANSGSNDFLHMIMGSHAAGQAGMNPLLGLFGGLHSLATGGDPHTASSLSSLIGKMGLQPADTGGGSVAGGLPGMAPPASPMTSPGVLGGLLGGNGGSPFTVPNPGQQPVNMAPMASPPPQPRYPSSNMIGTI